MNELIKQVYNILEKARKPLAEISTKEENSKIAIVEWKDGKTTAFTYDDLTQIIDEYKGKTQQIEKIYTLEINTDGGRPKVIFGL